MIRLLLSVLPRQSRNFASCGKLLILLPHRAPLVSRRAQIAVFTTEPGSAVFPRLGCCWRLHLPERSTSRNATKCRSCFHSTQINGALIRSANRSFLRPMIRLLLSVFPHQSRNFASCGRLLILLPHRAPLVSRRAQVVGFATGHGSAGYPRLVCCWRTYLAECGISWNAAKCRPCFHKTEINGALIRSTNRSFLRPMIRLVLRVFPRQSCLCASC